MTVVGSGSLHLGQSKAVHGRYQTAPSPRPKFEEGNSDWASGSKRKALPCLCRPRSSQQTGLELRTPQTRSSTCLGESSVPPLLYWTGEPWPFPRASQARPSASRDYTRAGNTARRHRRMMAWRQKIKKLRALVKSFTGEDKARPAPDSLAPCRTASTGPQRGARSPYATALAGAW